MIGRLPPNLPARNFAVDAPNKVWTGDITNIWTEAGRLYISQTAFEQKWLAGQLSLLASSTHQGGCSTGVR